ncbi:hypothetical protein STRDD11_02012 [Streptococcus sp. DD11]|uniref:hypothetical protein n=1 Tax=Streptococcus sp. DD11 TaxID=1777879 RepID=UPI00079711BB|nr:hypothetical protein [Streptococcus sp. DD11]KXT81532.1 hypothetical protein STRDD11_02012 [Streptococcus sp. DD11]
MSLEFARSNERTVGVDFQRVSRIRVFVFFSFVFEQNTGLSTLLQPLPTFEYEQEEMVKEY